MLNFSRATSSSAPTRRCLYVRNQPAQPWCLSIAREPFSNYHFCRCTLSVRNSSSLLQIYYIQVIRGRETGRFTFEALLLLTLLSNFHKSDAAKLNPFLRHIGEITDVEVLRKVCWAAEFAAAAAAR